MIHESKRWRADLVRDADTIRNWAKKKDSAQRQYILEKKIFVSAFSMRKLLENRKVPDRLRSQKVPVEAFRTLDIPHFLNWHRIEDHFDIPNSEKIEIDLPTLLNSLIHSYVFVLSANKSMSVTGFFVASDYGRKRRLYLAKLSIYLSLCRRMADTWPRSFHVQLGLDGSEEITVK